MFGGAETTLSLLAGGIPAAGLGVFILFLVREAYRGHQHKRKMRWN